LGHPFDRLALGTRGQPVHFRLIVWSSGGLLRTPENVLHGVPPQIDPAPSVFFAITPARES